MRRRREIQSPKVGEEERRPDDVISRIGYHGWDNMSIARSLG